MPRDASGNYTLPAGNPVTAGTVIEATWANDTMSDIANALTDSLSRSGQGGMLSSFLFSDETEALPAIAWTNEPSMGFYRAGGQDMRAVVQGQSRMRWINGTPQIWDGAAWRDIAGKGTTLLAADGDINDPGIAWVDEVDAGFYRVGDDDQRYAQSGADVFKMESGVLSVNYDPYTGSGAADFPVIGEKLRTEPLITDSDDTVVSVGLLKSQLTLVAQGIGDGNSNTFLGDVVGQASSWAYAGGSDYSLGLTGPISSFNNLVVHLTCREGGDAAGRFAFMVGNNGNVNAPSISISTIGGGGVQVAADSIMFSVFDTNPP